MGSSEMAKHVSGLFSASDTSKKPSENIPRIPRQALERARGYERAAQNHIVSIMLAAELGPLFFNTYGSCRAKLIFCACRIIQLGL